MNDITLYLKNGDTIMVDSVSRDVFSLYIDDMEYISLIMEMGRDGELTGYYTEGNDVVNPDTSRFIGMSCSVSDDPDTFYCVVSFAQKSEMEILQERLAALEAENEELRADSEYAEAGHILLGEESEE